MDYIINLFKSFRIGIKNLFYYFKVVWKDRQWDYSFIETLLILKYKKMYSHMISKRCLKHEELDKNIQALRICINILKRREEDFYTDIWHLRAGQYMEFNWTPAEEQDEYSAYVLSIAENLDEIDVNYSKHKYADLIRDRDWKTYNKLIQKYHEKWWD
jgi:hypothetical protein